MRLGASVGSGRVSDLLREAADRFVLPRYKALSVHEIEEKQPGDLVTVADREAEHFLTRCLQDLLPGSLVVGEEACAGNPEILRRFEDHAPVWVIDPVDGTQNFSKGCPVFCMMVALVQNNTPVMSWIHDPLSGRIVSAEAGAGAWLANERLSIPSAPKDQDMIGLLNFWYFKEPDRSRIKKQAAKQFKKIDSLSCAGHDFWAQAEGRRHFSFYRRLWPWDHIPGTLLMREAGGVVGQINGMSYRAGERLHGLLSAPDQETWLRIEDFLLHGQG